MQALDSYLESNPAGADLSGTTAADVRAKTQLMALLGLAAVDRRISYSTIQVEHIDFSDLFLSSSSPKSYSVPDN